MLLAWRQKWSASVNGFVVIYLLCLITGTASGTGDLQPGELRSRTVLSSCDDASESISPECHFESIPRTWSTPPF